MSIASTTIIKESKKELNVLLKTCSLFLKPRVLFLLALKKHDGQPVSKRALMAQTGLCSYSVHKWRTLYVKGGIELLLKHNKGGFKPSKFSNDEHQLLKDKLYNSENGIRGYKELLDWVNKNFDTKISYIMLYKYCKKNFGTKIKVARKYNAKKDEQAGETFKKTLLVPVNKL